MINLKQIAILLILSTAYLEASTNYFQPYEHNGDICFTPHESLELLEAIKLKPLYEQKIIYLEDQTNLYNGYTMVLENHVKQFKKQKVKVFFNGVLIGSGVTIIGAIIIIIKLAL